MHGLNDCKGKVMTSEEDTNYMSAKRKIKENFRENEFMI